MTAQRVGREDADTCGRGCPQVCDSRYLFTVRARTPDFAQGGDSLKVAVSVLLMTAARRSGQHRAAGGAFALFDGLQRVRASRPHYDCRDCTGYYRQETDSAPQCREICGGVLRDTRQANAQNPTSERLDDRAIKQLLRQACVERRLRWYRGLNFNYFYIYESRNNRTARKETRAQGTSGYS